MKYGCFFEKKSSVLFRTWNPDALAIDVLLYKDSNSLVTPEASFSMKKNEEEWILENADCSGFEYYKYQITHGDGTVHQVCDIWSLCCSANSQASQIIDISQDKRCIPSGWEPYYKNPFRRNYTDAVIYEMHVADWCAFAGKEGKFENLTDEKIINHLKELGVTHVQLLPSFDYAQTNEDPSYNWGYNPYHYNVVEGRYVKNMKDGCDGVAQFRKMIAEFHENGIAVNMDVVYNHTSGTGEYSLYDKTVPGYFYRLTDEGTYSDGSGCGNEIATNHPKVKEYVIESLKHWMKDYHVNGFRFDLMGVHEVSVMKEIYAELKKIDPSVMVYGEPWCGGSCMVENGCTKENIDGAMGIAVFNDNFRDAIKGAEFGGFARGSVQGVFQDEKICTGLCGSLKNKGGFTHTLGTSINYVECHDNYTLYDKLLLSKSANAAIDNSYDTFRQVNSELDENGINYLKKQVILSGAFVLLAQGTAFLNGGQDFMRSKLGNPDSYSADYKGGHQWTEEEIRECNLIDASLKEKNIDVFNWYKGLIQLRKMYPESFGSSFNASACPLRPGIIKYKTGDFMVIFNSSAENIEFDASGYKKSIDVSGGTFEMKDAVTSCGAMSFVILKK